MLNDALLKKVISSVLKIDLSLVDDELNMDQVETWDSLAHMNLVLALEDEFKIQIPDDDAANITSYKLIKIVITDLLSKVNKI